MPFRVPIGAGGGVVTLADGSTVAVSQLPEAAEFWACKASDTDPPALSVVTYTTDYGQTCLTGPGGSQPSVASASFPTVTRYGRNGERNMRVRCLWFYSTNGTSSTSYTYFLGWRGGRGVQAIRFAPDTTKELQIGIDAGDTRLSRLAGIALPDDYKNRWHSVELIYGRDDTRLSINGGEYVATDPMPDSVIGTGSNSGFAFRAENLSPNQIVRISNLRIDYF